jgi:hypothetical protein
MQFISLSCSILHATINDKPRAQQKKEFVLRFSGSQSIVFHAAVIFKNNKILQRKHVLDILKELLLRNSLLLHRIFFVVTHEYFFCYTKTFP